MLHPAYDLSFYEFDDEKDPQSYGVLLCDVVHGKPAMKPLYIGIGWYWYYSGFRYGSETLFLPTTRGWDSRFIQGYPYITAIRTTEEERREREPYFRQKIKPFLQDFDAVWDGYKKELMELYTEAKESRGLKDWGDIERLTNIELLSFFLDFTYTINRKEGEIHMIMMMASYYINGLFQLMWKDLFGRDAPIDPDFGRLMSGFENQDVKVMRELWRLSRKAVSMGLEEAFAGSDREEILRLLNENTRGREWLEEYHTFLTRHGWRCERMHAYDTPAWIERPSLALNRVKMLMKDEEFTFDSERGRIILEREQAEKNVLEKVPAEVKDSFEVLMKAAQRSGYWSEDHTYFCDFYVGALGRWIVTEFGRRFAQAGCIDSAEDVHFLHPDEIRKAAIPMGKVDLRPYVQRRKEAWKANSKIEPVPFYGDISQAQDVLKSDPTLSVSTQVPIVREELKADLYGAAAAPGVYEGRARVIMSADQLPEVEPGEILVAPGTSAAWTAAFSVIKGLVTDGGGALSHPVIMAREYGIPCVAGCVEGSQKIRTGMTIRIDGDLGVVYIKA
ncbi:putative PEP-utilizing enzyme, mobile domain protein [uncultured Desulfatiglans sp.]|uniref:Putative PEP-utilizing enzyme, mobile domain protein n=1 Tax=Uncultured Desulfatiglans sp. TaxID=1748965 RepID=A0A653A8R5_UNCDX|nr:putative PEP-utilizing enzyme, mobile domain protein [uncultured Desulfatiglans sp.]